MGRPQGGTPSQPHWMSPHEGTTWPPARSQSPPAGGRVSPCPATAQPMRSLHASGPLAPVDSTAAPLTSVSYKRASSPLPWACLWLATVSDLKRNALLFLNKPTLLIKSWLFYCFRSAYPCSSPRSAQAARVISKKAEASCTALLSPRVPSMAPTIHSQHCMLSSIHLQTLPTRVPKPLPHVRLSNNFLTWSLQTALTRIPQTDWLLSNRNLLVSILEAEDHDAGDRLMEFSPGRLPAGPHVQECWAGSLGSTKQVLVPVTR